MERKLQGTARTLNAPLRLPRRHPLRRRRQLRRLPGCNVACRRGRRVLGRLRSDQDFAPARLRSKSSRSEVEQERTPRVA